MKTFLKAMMAGSVPAVMLATLGADDAGATGPATTTPSTQAATQPTTAPAALPAPPIRGGGGAGGRG